MESFRRRADDKNTSESRSINRKHRWTICAQHEQHRANFELKYFSLILHCEFLNILINLRISLTTPSDMQNTSTSTNRESYIKLSKIEFLIFSSSYEDYHIWKINTRQSKFIRLRNSIIYVLSSRTRRL